MKTSVLLKTITVAGALAATLTLSACDMHISFGQDYTRQDEAPADTEEAGAEPTEDTVAEEPAPDSDARQEATTGSDSASASDSGTAGTSTNSGTSTSAGTDADSSTSTSTADSDSGASDSGASGGEGTGSEGVDLDEQGNGTIPAEDLEADIKNTYTDRGVYVDLVECRYDLKIIAKRGSTNCEVTDNGKTHYGTVKVTSVTSAGVGYQLEFPNIS